MSLPKWIWAVVFVAVGFLVYVAVQDTVVQSTDTDVRQLEAPLPD